ncbi:hypothetical protein XELAEV_18010997mg [Xenopus laevis]|uniref:Complement component C7 n=1 Tax=Xenopus laevis TaxID=8355 RepID=A0A974I2C0_XENLA|nr:hypothetical protein XELAEV_18010997mg [Xenopus laevis]
MLNCSRSSTPYNSFQQRVLPTDLPAPPANMRVEVVVALLLLETFPVFASVAPIHCKWSQFGAWSDCDGCSKTQTRRRTIEVYGQFGGLECYGSAYETQSCVPTRGCPIEDGCGDRFRCSSGQCISTSLVCNGDHDCEEDSLDEHQCKVLHKVCDMDKYPPNTELTGLGYNAITRKFTRSVIHTRSFGGKCRKVFGGDARDYYRLSENVLAYTFKVSVKNDFSYDFYSSSWSYVKETESRTTSNHGYYHYHKDTQSNTKEKNYQLMVIKNHVEVAQFINQKPEFLILSEPFWKELASLPSVYDYTTYRKFIDKYGTHFLQSGSLGGEYKFLFYLDLEKITANGVTKTDMQSCTSSSKNFIFVKYSSKECKALNEVIRQSSGSTDREVRGDVFVQGGEAKFVAGLSYFSLDNPLSNENRYAAWAGSVSNLPSVIKHKTTPLYELVKEVPCASVKKHYLKIAIEQYINEESPCRCKPCKNKGVPGVEGTQCVCYCKPYTYGPACQYGILAEGDPAVVDGSWSCWSSWSPCLKGTRRRVRNRVCNNPRPSGGGLNCIGDSIASELCEDSELEHLRTVEPHCFDISIVPTEFCPPAPLLENGYVQDANPPYPAGRSIAYTCKLGYTLVGDSMARCGEDLKWQAGQMKCQQIMCSPPVLPGILLVAPEKESYEIGDKITISCAFGLDLEGPNTISCTSSLTWLPSIKNAECLAKATPTTAQSLGSQCQPWEKFEDGKCSCRMPYECGASLDVCAVDGRNNKNVALTVCKMHALQCLGRKYTLTNDAKCAFPVATERSCDSCHPWEQCKVQTNKCVCREAKTCGNEGISICVNVDGKLQTMSECEAGIRKCQGENAIVVSLSPCDV